MGKSMRVVMRTKAVPAKYQPVRCSEEADMELLPSTTTPALGPGLPNRDFLPQHHELPHLSLHRARQSPYL